MSIMQININDSDISSTSALGSVSDNKLGGASSSSARSENRTETQSKLFGVKK